MLFKKLFAKQTQRAQTLYARLTSLNMHLYNLGHSWSNGRPCIHVIYKQTNIMVIITGSPKPKMAI